MQIGNKIERIRSLRGIKQLDMARTLGISQQAYSKMIKQPSISEETVTRLLERLGMSREDFDQFDGKAPVPARPAEGAGDMHVLNLTISGIDQRSMEKLLDFIRTAGQIRIDPTAA